MPLWPEGPSHRAPLASDLIGWYPSRVDRVVLKDFEYTPAWEDTQGGLGKEPHCRCGGSWQASLFWCHLYAVSACVLFTGGAAPASAEGWSPLALRLFASRF